MAIRALATRVPKVKLNVYRAITGLLVLVVPDSDGLVHGAGGYNGLPDAHIHTSDLTMVVGVGKVVKRSTAPLHSRQTQRK